MLMTDYTSKLLNLEDVIITNVENIADQLHIYLELPRSAHICPACGATTDRVHDYRMQTIKDLPLARDTFLHLTYDALDHTLDALVDALLAGPEAFKGTDPMDAYCGMIDTHM